VTILYRRLREDMPAADEEIIAAEHEGVKIEYLIAPLRIVRIGGTRHRDRVPAAEAAGTSTRAAANGPWPSRAPSSP